jgi:hypothetical protein
MVTASSSTSPDNGLALWLADDGDTTHAYGWRYGVRSPFDQVLGPLLSNQNGFLAPDRLPGESAHIDDRGALTLGPGANAVVTDLTFARVAIDVEGTTGALPWVVLREEGGGELAVGSPDCVVLAGSRMHVERVRDAVNVSVDGGESTTCGKRLTKGARVTVGLRGAPGGSVATSLQVARRPGD